MPTDATKTIKILLFEDNANDADLIAEHLNLSLLDFSIQTVNRLDTGIEALKKMQYDVVLLDLSLPDSLGIETLQKLIPYAKEEVIIVLTSSEDELLSLEALQYGAQDYLNKDNLSGEILRRAIRYGIERANLQHSIAKHSAEILYREALLQRIFDANADAMLILMEDYEIKFLNPAAGTLLESDQEKLVGATFPFEVHAGETTELEIPDPQDRMRLVELSAVELIWEGEKALLVILRDISQRRVAEIGMKREKERLSVTLESIADAVIATDESGAVERMNGEAIRLTGVTLIEDAISRPLEDVLHLSYFNNEKRIQDPATELQSDEFCSIIPKPSLKLKSLKGEDFIVTAETRRLLDEDGYSHGCVTVLRDITKHKRAEDELFQSEKLSSISLLAGGIAHDFNNMLSAILGNISMVRIDIDETTDHSKRLVAAEKAALQARSLTQQLLTFSKGGAPVLEVTTISEVVEESAQFCLRGSNVRCEVAKDDKLWPIDADKVQISQVINNLIINADQAMPNGGCIQLHLRNHKVRKAEVPGLKPGPYVCIEVRDEGIGIPVENLKRIFDPYFTTKEEGNGLGLAWSYSIINTHQGTITADSAPGVGSVFRVYLPKSSQPEKKTAAPKKKPEVKKEVIHQGKGRILVMDDMEAMMMVAGEILTVLGYEVEYSRNGEEAIQTYQKAKESGKPFDACVFDLTVPGGMGGVEAANILVEYDPQLIAIASSGYNNSNVMSDHKNSAFKAVVPKPYRIKEMSDALHEVLSSR